VGVALQEIKTRLLKSALLATTEHEVAQVACAKWGSLSLDESEPLISR
jgi:hypothetical protein